MKKLSYKAKTLLFDAGIIICALTLAVVIGSLLVMLFSTYAQASLINRYPYEAGTFQTLPQMQREWDREREIRKQQDYVLDRQIESDRQLQRDQEFDRQLDRLRRGY